MPAPRVKQLQLQQHLGLGIFGIQSSSGVTVDTQVPDLAGDFEIYDSFTSTVASGRADAYYQGQLDESQARILEIKVPVKGTGATPQYQLKVFAEGSGATPVYDGGLIAAPGTRTVLTIAVGSLSAQPTGEGRYHVLVEAHLDAGETLFVGRPFVKQR
jgi:hypothetical protein